MGVSESAAQRSGELLEELTACAVGAPAVRLLRLAVLHPRVHVRGWQQGACSASVTTLSSLHTS